MGKLDRITLRGYRSIQSLEDFELRDINVFVGANGAGKSNFLSFFSLLRSVMSGTLESFVNRHGTSDDLLYNGPQVTDCIFAQMHFGIRGYRFQLIPTVNQKLVLANEARYYQHAQHDWWSLPPTGDGSSALVQEVRLRSKDSKYSKPVYETINSWRIYHFHDTSITVGMRRYAIVEDKELLRENASNIAPLLLRMRTSNRGQYESVVRYVQALMPAFEDFILTPQTVRNGEQRVVRLDWRQRGSDYPMPPYTLSDGTIRFICLATALLQPEPPSALIVDEPELGLHPEGINLLAELLKSSSSQTQVIVATQSPLLLNHFSVDNVVVARWHEGVTEFERLNEEDYRQWLDDFSLGDLWARNVIGGQNTTP